MREYNEKGDRLRNALIPLLPDAEWVVLPWIEYLARSPDDQEPTRFLVRAYLGRFWAEIPVNYHAVDRPDDLETAAAFVVESVRSLWRDYEDTYAA